MSDQIINDIITHNKLGFMLLTETWLDDTGDTKLTGTLLNCNSEHYTRTHRGACCKTTEVLY